MEHRLARTRVQPTQDTPPTLLLDTIEQTTQTIYTLNAISASISREEKLDRVLDQALEWVRQVTGADAGTIFLLEEGSHDLLLEASQGVSERFITEHRRLRYSAGLTGAVARSNEPLVVDDLPRDPRAFPSAIAEGIKSCAGVPLRSDNKVVGVMNVLSRKPRSFTTADVEILLSIGNQIGVAIAKSQLRSAETESREQLHQKMNQLSELLKVSATFRASAPLDSLLDSICAAITSALGYRLVEINLLDPSTGLMIPRAFSGFTPEERERLRQIARPAEFYTRIMQPAYRVSNSYFISYRDTVYSEEAGEWAFLPDIDDRERGEDEWHQLDALAVPLHERDGKLLGMLYVDDPFDRKLPSPEQVQVLELFAQQAALAVENATLLEELQKSESKYRLLTETAGDLIFLLEPDGTLGFLSSSTQAILGYEPHALLGTSFSQLLAPGSRVSAPTYLLNPQAATEREGQCEVEVLRRDGGSAYLEIISAPVYENGCFRGEQGIARDISEKKRMEREIARRQRQLRRSQKREEQLTGYAATVIAAQEEERRRIARDLHDDTAQALIALSRQIEAVRDEIGERPEVAQRKLDDLRKITDQTLASVRRFSRDLRPSVLDDLGLVPALEWLVAENARRYKITTRLKVTGDERRLPPEVELACFRIAQEALNNSSKHAQATGAAVEFAFGPGWCRLSVSDNGNGFESPPDIADLAGRGRMGVMGMHERATLLGGNLSVRTAPGEGTRISVTIPLGDA